MSARPLPSPRARPLPSREPARLPLLTPFADRRLAVVTDIGSSGLVETSLVYRRSDDDAQLALDCWEHTPAWLQLMCGDAWDHAGLHWRVVDLVRRGDLPGSV